MISQRKFIRLTQVVFILIGIVLFFGNEAWFPSYYRPKLMALTAFLYSFIIQLPVLVFKNPSGANTEEKLFFRGQFQVALALCLSACGLGSLGLWGLYQVGIPYDKLVHFSFSAVMVISGMYLLQAWQGWSFRKAMTIIILVIGVSDVAWEFIEFLSDRYLHLGFFGQLFDHDSIFDMLSDLLGIITGGLILSWRGWMEKIIKSFPTIRVR